MIDYKFWRSESLVVKSENSICRWGATRDNVADVSYTRSLPYLGSHLRNLL